MRNLLRCRRGTAAFATVVALVPLIGVLSLGGEAGSWYVIKQHAQNAADGAAYAGALACAVNATTCNDGQSYDYRGKEVASRNAFCNAGGPSYTGSQCPSSLPTSASQTVTMDRGTWNGTSWTSSGTGAYVMATVNQSQPAYLASVLGFNTINIQSQAIAGVQIPPNNHPCLLALHGQISFQGSPNINASGCGLASDDSAANALNFTGGGMTIAPGTLLSAAGGCTGNATLCNTASTYQPPITDPFAALDTAMASLPTLPNCAGGLTAYSAATPCQNNNVTLTGNSTLNLTGGVYFISGQLQLKGNSAITGTGTFVLLPGASLSMKGTGSINITGNPTVTAAQLPPALQASAALFSNMAIYDYQNPTTPDAITIGGNSQITFIGNMYLPNTAVTFQGNPTVNANGCGNQLIASSIAFNGNPTLNFDFNNTSCPSANRPKAQYVTLVH